LSVAGIVLAAGRGARFGGAGSKLVAPFRGEALVRHAARTLLGSRTRPVVVVTGFARESVEGALAGLSLSFTHNHDHESGMASSLRAGLMAAGDCAGALILPGDMPLVTKETVDRLIAAFEAAPGCAAVVPFFQGRRGNPALLGRSLFARALALSGDEGARRILAASEGVIVLEVEDEGVLRDVDRKEDLTPPDGFVPAGSSGRAFSKS
jgi:molybdenum cofactor cytidylyltransferase